MQQELYLAAVNMCNNAKNADSYYQMVLQVFKAMCMCYKWLWCLCKLINVNSQHNRLMQQLFHCLRFQTLKLGTSAISAAFLTMVISGACTRWHAS